MKAILLLAFLAFVAAADEDTCNVHKADVCHTKPGCGWADSKCVSCSAYSKQDACANVYGCGYFYEETGDKCKDCNSVATMPFGECHRFIGCAPVVNPLTKTYTTCTDAHIETEDACNSIGAKEGPCRQVAGCIWTGKTCKREAVCSDYDENACPANCILEGTTCKACSAETDKAKCQAANTACDWCEKTTKCQNKYSACDPIDCKGFDTKGECLATANLGTCYWILKETPECGFAADVETFCNTQNAATEATPCTDLKFNANEATPSSCFYCGHGSVKCFYNPGDFTKCDCSRLPVEGCNTAKYTKDSKETKCIVSLTSRTCVDRIEDAAQPACKDRFPDLCTNTQTTLTKDTEDCAVCEINGYCAKKTEDTCWEACEKFPANTPKAKCENAADRQKAVHCQSCTFDGSCADKDAKCEINCAGAVQAKCESTEGKTECKWCEFGYCEDKDVTECTKKCDGLEQTKCTDAKLATVCQWCDINGYCEKAADTCKVDCKNLKDDASCAANTKCKWDAKATIPACVNNGAARIGMSVFAVVAVIALALF